MAVASYLVGGVLTIAGVGKVIDLVDKTDLYLKRGQVEETRKERVARLAANAFKLAGYFALAIGTLTLAHVLMSVGPYMGFLSGFLMGLHMALPSLGIGFGGLLSSEFIGILRQ